MQIRPFLPHLTFGLGTLVMLVLNASFSHPPWLVNSEEVMHIPALCCMLHDISSMPALGRAVRSSQILRTMMHESRIAV